MIDLEAYEDYDGRTDCRRPRRLKLAHTPKKSKWAAVTELYESDTAGKDDAVFAPTLNASNEELEWIRQHLAQFYRAGLIADVARRVKGGKEANVYCCPARPASGFDLIAAKLYRPRKFRSLKNTVQYQQGRAVLAADGSVVGPRDWRLHKAIAGKSRKGVQAAQTSWLMYEFTLMEKLHQARADVPAPIKHGEYALLMEYIGDEGLPAPALIEVQLNKAEALPLFERLIWNIEVLLQCGWVHGDLSAYNVLYWEGQVYIIDFPQVVAPDSNPQARFIFRRDVERICQYFTRCGVTADASRIANGLWTKWVSRRERIP